MVKRAVIFSMFCASLVMAQRPNFVLILADDLGIGDVKTYNPNSQANTVHMDALARAGMKFTNAHSASAVCSPTRYNIQTGDHPVRVAGFATRVSNSYNDSWLNQGARRSIAQLFKAKGYRTGYSGKWHLGFVSYNASGAPMTQNNTSDGTYQPDWTRGVTGHQYNYGYDYVFGHPASADIPPYKYYYNNTWASPAGSIFVAGAADAIATGVADTPADGTPLRTLRNGWRDGDWHFNKVQRRMQDSAVSYINQVARGPNPFFLMVAPSGPHTPNTPHRDYQGTTPHNYTDYVNEIDGTLGAVVAALKSNGVLNNTLIIITSDNGANRTSANITVNTVLVHQGSGVLGGIPLRGQKADGWEGGHRVPYIARWGDSTIAGSYIRPGTVNNELLSLGDYYRTVAAILDTTIVDTIARDSWNMLSAYLGNGSVQRIREAQFSTSSGGGHAIAWYEPNGTEWKIIFSSGSGGGFTAPNGTLVNPNQSYATLDKTNMQLFNLTTDLGETNDLLANGISTQEDGLLQRGHALMREYITAGSSTMRDPDTARIRNLVNVDFVRGQKESGIIAGINNGQLKFVFTKRYTGHLDVSIQTISGQRVFEKQIEISGNSASFPLPAGSTGLHILRIHHQGKLIHSQKEIF